MNYELAKQLKDAGLKWGRETELSDSGFDSCAERFPALSELIEACGERFHALEQKVFKDIEVEGGKWVAYSNENNELNIEAHIFIQGATPEEAVAKLWLELNKKI